MARTASDLTDEDLRSYQPDQKSNEWQMTEKRERAWELARMAARILCDRFGATRVAAFGSLVQHDSFSPWSDMDLAAWGIPADQFYRAVAAVTGISQDFQVNLADPESCRLPIQQSIKREGVEL